MFWNIFKKKTPQQTSNNDKSNFPLSRDKKSTSIKNLNIPISFLKRLMPVAQLLTEKEIQQLHITAASFTPGAIVFNRGTEVDSLTYIVKGDIFMEADNGSGLEISAHTFKALYPLSAGKLHYFTAIAGSEVTVINISKTILQSSQPTIPLLDNELKVSQHLQDNPFFNLFYQHFTQGELKIPTFPDIALKLRKAIQQDCEIADIVKIVNMDPVISAKLIQVVNSPIYRPVNPISNCLDAINRLGLTTTRNLVTAFSMNNLTQSKKPSTKKLTQYNWLQSIKVSSISYTLAQLTQKVDPDEALLAGLLHNIGALPILTFADSLPEGTYQPTDIDLCISEIHGQIGSIILEKWGFPNSLRQIPLQSTNWFTSTTEDLNLNDIVLLAKYHNILASPGKTELPLIITLPAFQKLEKQPLTPQMSLQILHDAKQQIAETMSFFSR
ncbi:HDOD domain-containing protein [Methylobacter tundripaludum]|uniref:Putative signal transduction protein n=1 Tax=Methylobacter tundripaludum (strain ATCC BAA-1195 / DSM 17260 / SV96) TaxID=697282 RepID=G3IYR4_METTV|nr:HDOD domain-containing protein [Methylobacter tundripaludum]EGW20112.1 putative signal transduction protein [Methylobacter tundripaludum SV96]